MTDSTENTPHTFMELNPLGNLTQHREAETPRDSGETDKKKRKTSVKECGGKSIQPSRQKGRTLPEVASRVWGGGTGHTSHQELGANLTSHLCQWTDLTPGDMAQTLKYCSNVTTLPW